MSGVVLLALASAACNALTGADDLAIELAADEDSDLDDLARGDGSGQNVDGSNSLGEGGAGFGGEHGQGGTLAGPATMGVVDGVEITGVALYQGVKRPLMVGGVAASTSVPIVAGRDGLLRIFYQVGAGYNGLPVTARITLGGSEAYEETVILSGGSSESVLGSTANIALPGAALRGFTDYQVALLQPLKQVSGDNGAARFPKSGNADFPVENAGPSVKIVLVPVRYGADGSNRMPDLSSQQLAIYRSTFYKTFPVATVDLKVGATLQHNSLVAARGTGWSGLLNALREHRRNQGASSDEYYYGLIAPESSFGAYCGSGCQSGVSLLSSSPTDATARVGVGVGFSGRSSAETAIHEVGHQHGRGHAPCGTGSGLDPSFPYSNASINSWGFDLLEQRLISPSSAKDFMSYCDPAWISDYTFTRLFERIRQVNGAEMQFASEPRTYLQYDLKADGSAVFLGATELASAPIGRELGVVAISAAGEHEVGGHYYGYSHLEGGLLFVERSSASVRQLEVVVDGLSYRLPTSAAGIR